MGHYNSVQHEFLLVAERGDCDPDSEFLLVATRGSCTPDTRKLFPSVFTAERREHSQKPDIVYDMIETLYTHGEKIELFSRSKRKGWESWGNQA
jgi:N6-adenosine-specific RNA methylase IME4